jgi:DNA (cytosine-5)-methyltransferase 1
MAKRVVRSGMYAPHEIPVPEPMSYRLHSPVRRFARELSLGPAKVLAGGNRVSAYRAVSLFSGCGGFCEGVRLAGFDVKGAVEHDRFAVETYKHNFPEVPLFPEDIHFFLDSGSEKWEAAASQFSDLKPGNIDLLFGGPPCQGYSQIGTRILDDPRNELYLQYVRILRALRPRVFLMENVPNMLLLSKGRFKNQALEAFAAAGYGNSGATVVAATDYGVPQLRRRAIFFGVRDGERLDMDAISFLGQALAGQKQQVMNVWQAIKDLPEHTAVHYEELPYPATDDSNDILNEMRLDRNGRWYTAEYKQRRAAGLQLLHNHHTKEIQDKRKRLIAHLTAGAKADSLPVDIWNGARPEKWRRLHPDKPAYTILAQMHRDLSEWVHPNHQRWITVREAARLQSFHDGFIFKSSEWQMLKQIGNAVPPLLARALAAAAEDTLDYLNGDVSSAAQVPPLAQPVPEMERQGVSSRISMRDAKSAMRSRSFEEELGTEGDPALRPLRGKVPL